MDVMLLNADFSPLQILPWQRAVTLLLEDRVLLVTAYEDRQVRSAHLALPWPAVVALKRFIGVRYPVRLTRRNVLARDGFACQYCGRTPTDVLSLTLDHVVPRSRATAGEVVLPSGDRVRVHSWRNLVAACARCNGRKGARTPAEAGMRLRTKPRAPTVTDAVRIAFARKAVPAEWEAFLP